MDCYRPEPSRFLPQMGLLLLALTCAFAQSPSPTTPTSELSTLLKKANAGDADAEFQLGYTYEQGSSAVAQDYPKALYWYRKAAGQGNNDARLSIARMYYEGFGVKADYAEAARWYGCPPPSEQVLTKCHEVKYSDLPNEARDLLRKLNCHVDVSKKEIIGSAVNLVDNAEPAYNLCCEPESHGPCASVLIGRLGTKWSDLSPNYVLSVAGQGCELFVVSAHETKGLHDICLPTTCSPLNTDRCTPTVLGFGNRGYQPTSTSNVAGPK